MTLPIKLPSLLLIPFAVIFPAFITLLFAYVLGVHFEPGVMNFTIF
ncbi:MAG: hypothetical protein IIC04_03185 [Proteobacteria bacterium]|nr:hypothetical protein [Pseudomonadota bacterium]